MLIQQGILWVQTSGFTPFNPYTGSGHIRNIGATNHNFFYTTVIT